MTAVRYPFSAVVGHDDLRLALLLNAVHPRIGGVLVRGEKGTAKSTIVRALAALLPELDVVPDCRFGCAPLDADPRCPDGPHDGTASSVRPAQLVELPVGATEDRLVGSLDLERALTDGVRAYQPGLLAAAHRGVLYVDEVNLLHDHLVDLLLDAAAMGRAHVEREGVSVTHAASFLLVGTMNPEEGELRPQLLDRFGLTVHVTASRDVPTRTEVVRRRLAFEADPAGFARRWEDEDADLAKRIAAARERVGSVVLPDSELRRISALCAAFEVDGMRGDLVLARTAVAHAAWRGAESVAEADVEAAARLALPHRRRRDPFDEPGVEEEQLQQALSDAAEHADNPPEGEHDGQPGDEHDEQSGDDRDGRSDDGPDEGGPDGAADPDDGPDGPDGPDGGPDGNGPDGDGPDGGPGGGQAAPEECGEPRRKAPSERPPAPPAAAFRARLLEVPGVGEGAPGRRSRSRSRTGRAVRASTVDGHGIHLPATLSAAAPHQSARGRSGPGLLLRRHDVRHAVREGREGNLVLFVVDASGSMAARERMSAVSGAVLSLLRDAYQRRDKVGVVTFRGDSAEVALPPTSSVDTAAVRMRRLRTGGRTPLADGLLKANKVVGTERTRDPRRRPLLVLLTDGKATVPLKSDVDGRARRAVDDALRAAGLLADAGVASVVVDCENGMVRLGLADRLAGALSAPCLRLEELSADNVAGVVRAVRDGGSRAA
ncbi:magnesium chelatase subunit D [Saccharopolyspora erythraea NRRL 2338]|uniref:Mg-protoporphyrin IX chelatase n=2 Tax=Saccharopolyspora erythraea TaxID=1836 RepID=A4FM72_SACEN|nr:putative cobaltochelatase [Saccharopolyspora erythraea]EQD82063.1 magnesium chelatase [Saccharopolyspora erythraea D]PFG98784.1 magnesium chelatase subunit D [Saccharopolyspora erythraea NRRL 2338]QRK88787.1 putative cobaltochelatase [Saccharopolyspora erythraea]CAM05147.1 putative magnesium-chelatase subunit [Saccharopolyspora erythraea NRRL 2338]